MIAYYLSHPEVMIDAKVPVPEWGLSGLGRQRAQAFAGRNLLPAGAPIYTSTERKAVELAEIIAAANGGVITARHEFGENDRSSTGFMPPDEFEVMADRFFAEPHASARGWEKAIDAQKRVTDAVEKALAGASGPVIFCGHGGVGTLLKCHVARRAIARSEDQGRRGARGGGNVFVFDFFRPALLADWTAFEDFAP